MTGRPQRLTCYSERTSFRRILRRDGSLIWGSRTRAGLFLRRVRREVEVLDGGWTVGSREDGL